MAKEAVLYKYRAMRSDGEVVKGVLAAYDPDHLFVQLENVKRHLISCQPVDKGGLALLPSKKIKVREKIQLYEAMSQMFNAGIPLLECLDLCRRSIGTTGMQDITNDMYRLIQEGHTLSEAMGNYKSTFSNIERGIVKAKEETGDLQNAFSFLVDYLVHKDEIDRQIKKATRYPLILLLVILATIYVMLSHVVPEVLSFVVSIKSESELGFATTSLMATSSFFQHYGLYLLGVIGVGVAATLFMYKQSSSFEYSIDRTLLKIPVVGELLRKMEISRFCSTLSSLYSSGIPITAAVKTAGEVISNAVIANSIVCAQEEIAHGKTISEGFEYTGEFNAIVIQMMKIGEESGGLSEILDQVVDFYDKDIEDTIGTMVTMIEPLLTLILASMIIWIAVAVFGPIYDLLAELPI